YPPYILVVETEAIENSPLVILDHDLRPGAQIEGEGAAARLLQVQAYALLATILVVKRPRPVHLERLEGEAPEEIGTCPRLDLDHLAPELRKRPTQARHRRADPEAHDAEPREGCYGIAGRRPDRLLRCEPRVVVLPQRGSPAAERPWRATQLAWKWRKGRTAELREGCALEVSAQAGLLFSHELLRCVD